MGELRQRGKIWWLRGRGGKYVAKLLEKVLEWAELHHRTCGSYPGDVKANDGGLTGRCHRCGSELSIRLTAEEADEFDRILKDDSEFSSASKKALRRIVQ
jgi:hypothetical protein